MMILLTITIVYTGKAEILDLRINDKGHTFMSVMVSFLIISRSHASLVRYMEARHFVGELMRCSRELIQHAVAFTRYERSKQARKWRAEIARRTCSLLRTVVVVLQHNKKREYVWQVAELTKAEKQALLLAVGGSNERSPLVLSIFIRTAISSHIESLDSPLDVNVELKLLSCTSDFIAAYHGLMKLLSTPYPFPMLQMTRTFLFVWVFTLPFALANDIISFLPLLLIVFFCTYGTFGFRFS
jgi:predicted membrane chloride channel (bestrophin family)